ncbi:hypothetical protein FSARC_5416 [Fusarium sarcochroum]|uniref:Uncharacterized protein n=1 Tax=Fusarium sarcochroum TaxID=1208366 RepID=A0A8H4X9J5_9HYPO|nr:hypothetical protein FSARC_5416 [Fusarium sarcochroum]
MDNTRRPSPSFFSSFIRKYRNISPDHYQMEHGIALSPIITKHKDVPTPTAKLPSVSTELRLGQESPWNDPSSPDFQEPLASRGRTPSQIELLSYNQATPGSDAYQLSPPLQPKSISWWATAFKRQLLAFITKANFVIAVFMAHQQVAWRAVGQQGYSVHAIDSLFGAAHNAIELFNKEAWNKSWLAMFLAMYIWISPFLVIFTSATLSVVLDTKEENTMCASVRTLNFSHEAKKKWTEPRRADNDTVDGIRGSWYNETTEARDGPDSFDYWDQPNRQVSSITSSVLTGGQALQKENVAADICSQGWNCSTTIYFTGPGYRCRQLAKGVNSTIERFGKQEAPFNLSTLVPAGDMSYYTIADKGEYARPQIRVGPTGGRPLQRPPFPKSLGAFRTEPIIWLGYVTVDDETVKHAQNSSEDGWETDYTPIISACEHWEIDYTVNLTYTNGFQSYNVTKREFLRKVINTTYVDDSADDGTYDKTVAEPEDSYVFPRD